VVVTVTAACWSANRGTRPTETRSVAFRASAVMSTVRGSQSHLAHDVSFCSSERVQRDDHRRMITDCWLLGKVLAWGKKARCAIAAQVRDDVWWACAQASVQRRT